ncbi:MAG TPA: hypothetical protein VE258_06515, partial [Ktedonobacterales bacterium]|nr:hypothetical protein [Ktedonobacterales bacterium]
TVTAALALPATLRTRLAWRTKQMAVVTIVVLAIVEAIYCITLLRLRDDPTITLADELGVQGILLGILACIFVLMCFIARECISVTDGGLSVRRFGMTSHIRWKEARLFAMIRTSEFELSGPRDIVRWTRPVDASSYDTVLPFVEYQRQMDSLLVLIGERTGLPLTDLRQPAR